MTHPMANPPSRTRPPGDSLPTASAETTNQETQARVAVARLAAVVFVGTALWFVPVPSGVQPRAWHLLAVFVATMVGIILRPIPMGAMAFVAVAFAVLSGTLTISEATAGFGSTVVWLVVAAFFIATAFIKTGLGIRIAYHFMRVLGHSSLGLAYGLVATDLVLAPAIPSNTARAGGVVYPILKSICTSLGSDAEQGTERRIAGFLTFTAYQGVVVTSAMFFTGMAANPLAAEFAAQQGVEISWELWALAASVPGALSLLFVPLLIYRLYPPEIKRTPEAPALARKRLREMGAMDRDEWILLTVFILILNLWIFGGVLGVHTTTTAMVGVGAMLATGALDWEDILKERSAWDTLIWFAVLVMMASQLGELGLLDWFSDRVSGVLADGHWPPSLSEPEPDLLLLPLLLRVQHRPCECHVRSFPCGRSGGRDAAPPGGSRLGLLQQPLRIPDPLRHGSGSHPIRIGERGHRHLVEARCPHQRGELTIWLGVGSLWWKLLGLW